MMTWQGTLPAGFTNKGTVLDRSVVKVQSVTIQAPDTKITIQGYSGHTYQLQFKDSLTSGAWTNADTPVAGATITFTHTGGTANPQRFYRIVIDQ